jgi:hypothetical protein
MGPSLHCQSNPNRKTRRALPVQGLRFSLCYALVLRLLPRLLARACRAIGGCLACHHARTRPITRRRFGSQVLLQARVNAFVCGVMPSAFARQLLAEVDLRWNQMPRRCIVG